MAQAAAPSFTHYPSAFIDHCHGSMGAEWLATHAFPRD
jgi:hypothetical protein